MKKGIAANIAVTLCSLALVLFIAELVMRFTWHMKGWVERPIYQRSANPYLRYELVANVTSDRVSINNGGFRGPGRSIEKPAHVFRIAMLGDSETLSFLLPQKDTLSSQLEAILNQPPGKPLYEVLNFGVEGYNTLQELEQLKTKVLKYNPDLIIVNYCLNDPEPGEYYFNKTFLMRHSALVRYFTYRIKKAMIKRERKKLHIDNEIEHYFYLHQPKYFVHIKEAFLKMAEIARQRGNKLVVVIFPASSTVVKDFKQGYPYWALHSLVRGIRSDNIIFIDLIDEFNRVGLTPETCSINYKMEESHKNPAALDIASRYLKGILESQRLIPVKYE